MDKSQVALVTGAASGIGRAVARELSRRGWTVAAVDKNTDGLGALAHELPTHASTHAVDLTDAKAMEAMVEDVLRQHGTIDLLINNAGVILIGPFAESSLADWEWIFQINVWAPIRLTRLVLPHMLARGHGQIAVTASAAGLFSFAGLAAYTTTKAAMVAFCEALRAEVLGQGVGVSVICPGQVQSNLSRAARFSGAGGEGETRRRLFGGLPADKAARLAVDGLAGC